MSIARRQRLLELVTARGFLRVTDAALELGVSEVTVRGDLSALDSQGAVVRVHGGAMPRGSFFEHESSVESSLERDTAAKRAIGASAAALVGYGDSVYIDVGSTALAVAQALVARRDLHDIVVVTNGLTIALALEAAGPRFTIIVTGGTLRPLQHSLVNPNASTSLASLHVDVAFIGCNGVDPEHGVTNINLPEAEIKREMLRHSRRHVLIADASKLGQTELGVVGAIDEFEMLVTAGGPDVAVLERLRAARMTVVIADQ